MWEVKCLLFHPNNNTASSNTSHVQNCSRLSASTSPAHHRVSLVSPQSSLSQSRLPVLPHVCTERPSKVPPREEQYRNTEPQAAQCECDGPTGWNLLAQLEPIVHHCPHVCAFFPSGHFSSYLTNFSSRPRSSYIPHRFLHHDRKTKKNQTWKPHK